MKQPCCLSCQILPWGSGREHIGSEILAACSKYVFINKTLDIFFFFLGPHPLHVEVPRSTGQIGAIAASHSHSCSSPGSEPHIYTTTYGQILNPLSEARDGTCVLTDTSQLRHRQATTGTSDLSFLSYLLQTQATGFTLKLYIRRSQKNSAEPHCWASTPGSKQRTRSLGNQRGHQGEGRGPLAVLLLLSWEASGVRIPRPQSSDPLRLFPPSVLSLLWQPAAG